MRNFMWKNSGLSNNFDDLSPNHLSGSGLKFRINEAILHWKNLFPLNSVQIPNIPDYWGPDYRDMTVFSFHIAHLTHFEQFFFYFVPLLCCCNNTLHMKSNFPLFQVVLNCTNPTNTFFWRFTVPDWWDRRFRIFCPFWRF